jgi:hypothetical protein
MLAPRLILTIAVVTAFAGCTKPVHYVGDGRFIDNGWSAATERYVLELGPVEVAHTGTTEFNMTGLPPMYMVVGLQVPGRVASSPEGETKTPADISVELVQLPDDPVLLLTGALRHWNRAEADGGATTFFYQRQASRSYFDAFPENHYRLRVTVNTPDPAVPSGTFVVLKTGGWK